MKVIEKNKADIQGGIVAGIGFFDGVHRGHRMLISEIIAIAQSHDLASGVITFSTHPREVLHADYCPRLLSSREDKLQRLSTTGIDYCIILNFTVELSKLSAKEFIEYIAKEYHVRVLVIGYDHRFGHNRSEGFDDYVRYGAELGVEILQSGEFLLNGEKVSSSVIRQLILDTKVEKANELLGSPYTLSGKVVKGYQLGRTLGFPTANLEISPRQLFPGNGVYAVKVLLADGTCYDGMMNVGKRPTLNRENDYSIEVNLFDFDGDLYDQQLQVQIIAFLRPEIKMKDIETLKAQIEKDKEHAKRILLKL